MNWHKLVEAGTKFDKIGQEELPALSAYDRLMKELDRTKLPETAEVMKIYTFMNRWFSRVALLKFEPFCRQYQLIWGMLSKLSEFSLEKTSLDLIVKVGDENLRLSRIVHYCFDVLSEVIGSTPTSKALHVSAPSMLVMWDRPIREEIAHGGSGYDYSFVFLPKMKKEIDEVVASYALENHCNDEAATNQIRNRRGKNYTLAKMVDEYNWVTITRHEQL
jgi:hypothetical protein